MTENGVSTYMPVAPAYGNGFGGMGDDIWLILILLFAFGGGGWGMGGFGGGFGGMYEFPWLLNGQNGINANTNAGFNQQAITSGISGLQNSITSGFGDVQLGIAGVNQNICQTGSGITQAVANGFAQAEIANNARQIADMQQNFANQTATLQGFNGIQGQLSQCCCDNRLATVQTQNVVTSEGAATRAAIQNQTQAILDKLCQQEIEAKNDTINQLRSELLYARGQASQDIQTAAIQAGQRGLANEVEQYVAPRPIPSYVVPSPYTNNCGCACAAY